MYTLPLFTAAHPARAFVQPWDPFRHLEQVLDDMTQALSLAHDERATNHEPSLNVWSGPNGLVVTAEIAGADPDSLQVSVVDNTLTLRGTRAWGVGEAQEREEFSRSLQLPYRIDANQTEARCKDGIITIALRRPETEQPKRIAIQTA